MNCLKQKFICIKMDLALNNLKRLIWYLSLTPTRQDLTQSHWPEGQLKVGIKGSGSSDTSRGSSLAGLCWSSTHLVQCGPDEPCWTWTQIWVQARMPDYSLNWTARSSAIQGWQRCQWCSLPTQGWPSRNWRLFSLESAIGSNISSGTNAKTAQLRPGKYIKVDMA